MKKIQLAGMALVLVSTAALSIQKAPVGDFQAKCAGCHGADGKATSSMAKAMKIASFKTPEQVKLSDDAIFDAIKNGKGSRMPAFGGKLTDQQIKLLVGYVRTLQK